MKFELSERSIAPDSVVICYEYDFAEKNRFFCFHCAHACTRVVYTITQCCVHSFCSSIQWLNRDRTRAAVPTIQSHAMILWCFLFTIIIGSTKQKREKKVPKA